MDGKKIIGALYVGLLERPYKERLINSILIFVYIAILGIILVWYFSFLIEKNLVNPIRDLTEAVLKVSKGDYSIRSKADRKDEIGLLQIHFNEMVKELDEKTKILKEWTNNLEKKVQEKTEELKEIQRGIFQAEKLAAIGKLAAGVAHEINNPLTGILTNASLLLEELPENNPKREDLKVILNETLRCRKIVKGLLDFSRQTVPQKQKMNMGEVFRGVYNLIKNQENFKKIKFHIDLKEEIPLLIDSDQMNQVILNILINAMEAMEGRGEIFVSSEVDEKERKVIYKFRDTGPGVSEEIKEKIFEPFFTTKKMGTGLGLSIVYGIMEQHNAKVEISSEVGKGTEVRLIFNY